MKLFKGNRWDNKLMEKVAAEFHQKSSETVYGYRRDLRLTTDKGAIFPLSYLLHRADVQAPSRDPIAF